MISTRPTLRPNSQRRRTDEIPDRRVQLADEERKKLKEIGELLIEELDVDIKKLGTNENAATYVRKLVEKIIKNYKIKVTPDSLDRLMYYIVGTLSTSTKIDPMMRDPWNRGYFLQRTRDTHLYLAPKI